MLNRVYWMLGIAIGLLVVASCAPPQTMPEALTPIPTLIPATSPAGELEPSPTPVRLIESFPAGIPSAARGQALYMQHCAACHGEDGNGLVPNARNFGDVDYMRGESPVEIYTVITEGRGDEMPAFGNELTSDERWDVVYYVWRFSTDEERLQRGKEIYEANCVTCHGEDGRSMILGAADFSDPRVMADQTSSDLYVVVTQGIGSMPAWQARLSQDERWAVIDYVRTFTYDPQVGEAVAGAPTPTEEAEATRPECAPYAGATNPFDWGDAQAIAAGESIYASCAGCHGQDGAGAIPGTPDFTSPVFQGHLREDPGGHFCTVAEGLNAMPGWKTSLSDDQIWQVLTYIGEFGG